MRRGRNRQLIDVLDPDNLPEDLEREIAHLRRDENYSRLIHLVIEQVAGVSPERRTAALLQGLDLVEQLMVATNRPAWESVALERNRGAPAVPYIYWRHIDIALLDVVAQGESPVRLDDALEIAAGYLRMPFRVHELDRQILDMLLAANICEFATAREAPLAGRPRGLARLRLALLQRHVWRDTARQRQPADELLEAMQRTYSLLSGQDNALRELEDHIETARILGASWSAGLIALLDDILMRRTTI
jgi:hypothetical protein